MLRIPSEPTATELYECALGFQQERYVQQQHYAVTANLLTYRTVADHVGVFNSTLKSGGDADWGRRVHAAGYQVIYADDAVVGHPTRHRLVDVLSQTRRIAGGIHDRRKEQDRVLFRFLQNIVLHLATLPTTAIRIWLNRNLSTFQDKAKIILVMAAVRLVLIWEQLRLQIGLGTSQR